MRECYRCINTIRRLIYNNSSSSSRRQRNYHFPNPTSPTTLIIFNRNPYRRHSSSKT